MIEQKYKTALKKTISLKASNDQAIIEPISNKSHIFCI